MAVSFSIPAQYARFFLFCFIVSITLLCSDGHARCTIPVNMAVLPRPLRRRWRFYKCGGIGIGNWEFGIWIARRRYWISPYLNSTMVHPFCFLRIFILIYVFNEIATWSRLRALRRDNHTTMSNSIDGNLFIFSDHSWSTTPAPVSFFFFVAFTDHLNPVFVEWSGQWLGKWLVDMYRWYSN